MVITWCLHSARHHIHLAFHFRVSIRSSASAHPEVGTISADDRSQVILWSAWRIFSDLVATNLGDVQAREKELGDHLARASFVYASSLHTTAMVPSHCHLHRGLHLFIWPRASNGSVHPWRWLILRWKLGVPKIFACLGILLFSVKLTSISIKLTISCGKL